MMPLYSKIEEISQSPRFGNSGPDGWGFRIWSDLIDDEAPHRALLERFASKYPHAGIKLPAYDRYEDYVECEAAWGSSTILIYYETIVSLIWLWSTDREAMDSLRSALLPLVEA